MSRYSTVEVSLEDFELDDIIDYLEDYDYVVQKKSGNRVESCDNGYTTRELAELISGEEFRQCSLVFWNDLLTDVLCMPSMSSKEQILERLKKKLN